MLLALGALFVLCGALLVGLGVPMMRRRVPPNAWYGLRVPATLSDEKVWYEANAASGRDMVWLGGALVVLALVLPFFGVSPEAYAFIWCAVLVVGAVATAVKGWRYADRLQRELKG